MGEEEGGLCLTDNLSLSGFLSQLFVGALRGTVGVACSQAANMAREVEADAEFPAADTTCGHRRLFRARVHGSVPQRQDGNLIIKGMYHKTR